MAYSSRLKDSIRANLAPKFSWCPPFFPSRRFCFHYSRTKPYSCAAIALTASALYIYVRLLLVWNISIWEFNHEESSILTTFKTGATEDARLKAFKSNSKNLYPSFGHPSRCYMLHVPDGYDILPRYSFNARTFCLTSAMCIETVEQPEDSPRIYFSSSPTDTQCVNSSASFREPGESGDCGLIQQYVYCAHGRYQLPFQPTCPQVNKFSDIPGNVLVTARWLPGIVVVIPAFHHLKNIFHFSFILGTTSHLLSALPNLFAQYHPSLQLDKKVFPVTLLFRGESPLQLGKWQAELIQALVNYRLLKVGVYVSVETLNENTNEASSGLVCAHTSLLLGRRSSINLWPFPSVQMPQDFGTQVTVEAVAFRSAVYEAMGVETRLPSVALGSFDRVSPKNIFDLPPLTLGYARRNLATDAPDGQPQNGTKRRFSDSDEAWFTAMLKEEAKFGNIKFTMLQFSRETDVKEQVQKFSKVGFVVGIHGANLMNTIFMKPFSGMLEIFPTSRLPCYFAGGNSGIGYMHYVPTRKATREESGCYDEKHDCWTLRSHRRVVVSEDVDRAILRDMVRRGIARLSDFHQRFGHLGGVPVTFNEDLSVFSIA